MFLDAPGAKVRDDVHLILSGEKVSPESLEPSPDVQEIDDSHSDFRLLDLDALVRMLLIHDRRIDRVHLRDMMEIGMLDESWLQSVPSKRSPKRHVYGFATVIA